MKIILSRKGFDSENGSIPSPIFPDGTMISMPIPTAKNTGIKYSDLRYKFEDTQNSYSSLLSSLYDSPGSYTKHGKKENLAYFGKDGPLKKVLISGKNDAFCHLDPDLTPYLNPLAGDSWTGSFGQVGSSQTHLFNQGVNCNQIKNEILFLFFGWFKNTTFDGNNIKFIMNENSFQAIYGYMFVKHILKNGDIKRLFPWHPHSGKNYDDSNTLYVAENIKIINGKPYPGFGVFKYSESLKLTKDDENRTLWDYAKLPNGIKDGSIKLTYHQNACKEDYFKSACKGQEFVFTENDSVTKWALDLIKNNITM